MDKRALTAIEIDALTPSTLTAPAPDERREPVSLDGGDYPSEPEARRRAALLAAQEAHVLASLLESRRGAVDPLGGLAESFFAEIQPLLETPWAAAMADLVYPQTRGDRPPDFERRLQYTRGLMRLAAEDHKTDRILFEVRALLRPQSALREPELASRVMAMMAPA